MGIQAGAGLRTRMWAGIRAGALIGLGALAGCSDPVAAPVDLFHDLEGGEIAAQRPPPPGAGQPYPHLGSVPPKPVVPSAAYRNGLQAQLLAERDRTERVAADTPLAVLPPPPPRQVPVIAPAVTAGAGAAAQAGAQVGDAAQQPSAMLDAADSPPAASKAVAPPSGQGGLVIEGAPSAMGGVPEMPAAPPPPASFEGVAAEPAPSMRILSAGQAPAPAGAQVFFADGSAVLAPSQTQALKDFLSGRRKQAIEVVGMGGAASDTPDGQAAAVELALRRARAVQVALEAQHVAAGSIRLSANAFGRGVVLRLLP